MRRSLLFGLLLVLGGCKDSDTGDLVPVTGTVTLDNKELANAVVRFDPTGETKGQGGIGVTDASGKFVLKQRNGKEGVPPGTYKVIISKLVMPDGSDAPPDATTADSKARELLLPRYSDAQASKIETTVTPGSMHLKFTLRSK